MEQWGKGLAGKLLLVLLLISCVTLHEFHLSNCS